MAVASMGRGAVVERAQVTARELPALVRMGIRTLAEKPEVQTAAEAAAITTCLHAATWVPLVGAAGDVETWRGSIFTAVGSEDATPVWTGLR